MVSSQGPSLPTWAIDLGWEIDRIVAKDHAMAHWREQVQQWARELAQFNADGDRFDQEREQYFAEDVKQDPGLRDRSRREYPEEKGLLWEHDPADETYAMSDLGIPEVGAWVPAELCENQRPKADLPLPIVPGRELSLSEKYAILAAVHDLTTPGQPSIDPWCDQVDGSAMLEGQPYAFLLATGPDEGGLFEDHCELAFRSYLEHVKVDLAKQPLTAPDGKVSKPKGTPKWSPKYRKDLEQEARKVFRYSPKATREDIHRRLEISTGSVSKLVAWRTRNSKQKTPGPSRPSKNLTIVGKDITDEEGAMQHHRHVGKPQQEHIDEQLDEDLDAEARLMRLTAEQSADARLDKIPLD